ncbi:MAG: LysM peptidoglycan-binding domain-containing protein [Cytophagales bacterium]|nr:LysM peptidoglycan-binding domain-containing protein [Cytophagales bacterium]
MLCIGIQSWAGNTKKSKFLDFAPEESDSTIAKRIKAIDSDMEISYNKTVRGFIDYFTIRNRNYSRKILKRADVYFPLFEEQLKKHNIPTDLKYLTIVESAIDPHAKSYVGALGLWQFMPSTGKMFNLDYDWYVDERMSPYKSTEAACLYLKELHGIFNDWELALAAYNCGPGNVRRAIRRSGYKETFWEIYDYLPKETRGYVPQFMAVTYMMHYAEEHNLFVEDNELNTLPKVDTLLVNQYLNLEIFSKELNICVDDLLELNPDIKRNVVPEHRKNFKLLVPSHKMAFLTANKDSILVASNVKGKEELNLKAPSKSRKSSNTQGKVRIVYKVRSGDVLGKIAQKYNVKTRDLRTWNNIRGNMIHPGQKLAIYKHSSYFKKKTPKNTVAKNTKKKSIPSDKIYTVKSGDSLWSISNKYGLTVKQLKKLNKLKSNSLRPGQKLKLG